MDRERLERRRKGIGASEAAAACGLSPWKTPLDLWAEKRGLKEPDDLTNNARVFWGRHMEAGIASGLQEKHPEWVIQPGAEDVQHPTIPFLFASPDRYLEIPTVGKALLQIKTAGAEQTHKWEADAPLVYLVQVQHEMLVTELQLDIIACVIGGNELVEKPVPFHQEFVEKFLLPKLEAFWRYVERNQEPPVSSPSDLETLKAMYRTVQEEVVPLDAELLKAHADLEEAKERMKFFEKQSDISKARILAAMGPARRGVMPNGVIYSRIPKHREPCLVSGTDWIELRVKHPKEE